ncbi:zinc finger dihydrouridine synthase [Boletus edulis BED1]|uniref:tRNA-dihydrouridine(47) synthase [NAD(P)(+)] n=1 Tax=Boletus edulis BED1 TaxID=1328754 RepID=A0AAD4GM50_BOLED|nr:zinc finger dihydrouridine synthase [Boletus edulis BED1]
MTSLPQGTASVKAEFLLSNAARPAADDDAAEGSTSHTAHPVDPIADADPNPGGRKKLTRQQKKAHRGANKGRRFGKVRDELELCWRVANGTLCEHGAECRFTHDIRAYLAAKPRDIKLPFASNIISTPPFTPAHKSSLDFSTTCPSFDETGNCRLGLKCRFLGAHAHVDNNGAVTLITDEEKKSRIAPTNAELNQMSAETLKLLRQNKYPRPITNAYLKEIEAGKQPNDPDEVILVQEEQAQQSVQQIDEVVMKQTGDTSDQNDTPDVPTRFTEKKRLHWAGKTYPFPFRRLCVTLGADITCGEMGLATSFLTSSREEWSLVRRHPSESIFGVQLAGNKPSTMVPTAEVLGRELANGIDFVDINCGCPIDLVFKTGSGSALLDTPAKLGRIVVGMNKALGEIPVTVKLRTGVKEGRNTAHKLMPRLRSEWGVGCITLHGRTRQQRYTKLADWGYIKECVDAVRTCEADQGLSPIPIFGGGDCFSSQDYWEKVDTTGVDGIMIGRGALIKPWIFTEIQERREWDISSRERLELVRKYAEFGLTHFGTDTVGVNKTRRYLCEALSFQHRYIPIGLLERLPAQINERAPAFRGRDELETLFASPNCQDWVRISEMFLGPVPETWTFTPKHKSNAYGEESQG